MLLLTKYINKFSKLENAKIKIILWNCLNIIIVNSKKNLKSKNFLKSYFTSKIIIILTLINYGQEIIKVF